MIRRQAEAAGRGRYGRGQYLRGDGRGGAAVAAGDPQARARASRRADRGDRLRGADRARHASPPCRRSRCVLGNEEKLSATSGTASRGAGARAFGLDADEKVVVNDIMAVTETARASGRRPRRPRARLRAGAERLRSPLHLLHHSRTAAAIRARCRWARWWRRCAGSSRAAIARSCSPASISPAMARTCRARPGSARW